MTKNGMELVLIMSNLSIFSSGGHTNKLYGLAEIDIRIKGGKKTKF